MYLRMMLALVAAHCVCDDHVQSRRKRHHLWIDADADFTVFVG